MKIGIVTTFNADNPAGLERCTLDLIKSILSRDASNKYLIYTKKNSGLKKSLESTSNNFQIIEIGWGKFWKDIGLFFAPRADKYVFNGPQVPLFFKPKQYFTIIYDFAYYYIGPNNFKERIKRVIINFAAKLALNRSNIIISISQATKDEAIKLFKVPTDKIAVMYLGYKNFAEMPDKEVKVADNFFLFSGTIKARKNVLNIVKAFIVFKQNKIAENYKLYITGKCNHESLYIQEIIKVIKDNYFKNDIVFLGYASDYELAYLYKKARALVYPSLIEGFGFPILEAFSCNLPVITSNRSSLSEVAGEAAILVDPHDIQDLVQAMGVIASDDNLRKKLINKGKIRAREFSWEKAADEFIYIINKI